MNESLLFHSLEEVDAFFERFLNESKGVVSYNQYPQFTHCTSGKNEGSYVNSQYELPAGVYWGVMLDDSVYAFFRFGYNSKNFNQIKPFVEQYSDQIKKLLGSKALFYGPKDLKGFELQDESSEDLAVNYINPSNEFELKECLFKFYEMFDNLRKWKKGEEVTWFVDFNDICDVVKYANKKLASWCDAFGQKRKEFVGLQKSPAKGKLFGDKNIKDRSWAINEGGHKEIQYHIFHRDGKIGYGLGFSVEYTPYYNDKSNIEYLKPFTDAYCAIKDDAIVHRLKSKGHSFIYGSEDELSNIKDNTYYCFGKVVDNSVISMARMIADIKGDMYELYCKVFEAKNNNLWGKKFAMKNIEEKLNLLKLKKNIILQGAPGTGKTYATAALALSLIDPSFKDFDDHQKVMVEYEKYLMKIDDEGFVSNEGRIGFVTFHQSMDYEDFIEGIKPVCNDDSDEETSISYQIQSGIFKAICQKAKVPKTTNFESAYTSFVEKLRNDGFIGYEKCFVLNSGTDNSKSKFGVSLNKKGNLTLWTGTDENNLHHQGTLTRENMVTELSGETVFQSWKGYFLGVVKHLQSKYKLSVTDDPTPKNYVLIIDEINRGNVSKIFGELISLLEADKRQNGTHPLKVTLPYSKESFSVPSNLYIIGTMNTTDRSVGSIDYAVRRRFAFYTLKASEDALKSFYSGKDNGLKDEAIRRFNKTSTFIESYKSTTDVKFDDLMVGHSYFMAESLEDLELKWKYEVLPLLEEYKKDGLLKHSAKIEDVLT